MVPRTIKKTVLALGPFIEAVGRDKTAFALEAISKRRLGFGVRRPGVEGGVFPVVGLRPCWHQPPLPVADLLKAVLARRDEDDVLCRRDVLARFGFAPACAVQQAIHGVDFPCV